MPLHPPSGLWKGRSTLREACQHAYSPVPQGSGTWAPTVDIRRLENNYVKASSTKIWPPNFGRKTTGASSDLPISCMFCCCWQNYRAPGSQRMLLVFGIF